MHFFNHNVVSEIPLVAITVGVIVAGLWLANVAYDAGVPQYVSRKIGHGAGGVAFLLASIFSAPGWPITLAAGFGAPLMAARPSRPSAFRGVGGNGRSAGVMAEVWFAWAAVPVFFIAW